MVPPVFLVSDCASRAPLAASAAGAPPAEGQHDQPGEQAPETAAGGVTDDITDPDADTQRGDEDQRARSARELGRDFSHHPTSVCPLIGFYHIWRQPGQSP